MLAWVHTLPALPNSHSHDKAPGPCVVFMSVTLLLHKLEHSHTQEHMPWACMYKESGGMRWHPPPDPLHSLKAATPTGLPMLALSILS